MCLVKGGLHSRRWSLGLALALASLVSTSCSEQSTAQHAPSAALQVGEVQDLGVLAHPVCTLSRAADSAANRWIFAEGDVCPVGGGGCVYQAVIQLDAKDRLLPRTIEGDKSSTFQSADGSIKVEIVYKLPTCANPGDQDCETTEGKGRLTVTRGKDRVEIEGYVDCGA
jgi:hypothetical protein